MLTRLHTTLHRDTAFLWAPKILICKTFNECALAIDIAMSEAFAKQLSRSLNAQQLGCRALPA